MHKAIIAAITLALATISHANAIGSKQKPPQANYTILKNELLEINSKQKPPILRIGSKQKPPII